MAPVVQATETLTIAVASSLYIQMQQKAKSFEKEHDVRIRLITGSTGRLYNQIKQGAKFDVFIAADQVRPDLLLKQGIALSKSNTGKGYLGLMLDGKLVSKLTGLNNPNIQHIAIANPNTAPFGLAAKTTLQQQGLWKLLKPKFVYAQNALQSRMLVEKGLVDAGFIPVTVNQPSIAIITYYTVLLADKKVAHSWLTSIAPQHIALKTHTPVIPAKAGNHILQESVPFMDSRLRGNDGL